MDAYYRNDRQRSWSIVVTYTFVVGDFSKLLLL